MPVGMIAVLVALAGHDTESRRARRRHIWRGVELTANLIAYSRLARSRGLRDVAIRAAGLQTSELELVDEVGSLGGVGPRRLSRIAQILAQTIAHSDPACHAGARAFDLLWRYARAPNIAPVNVRREHNALTVARDIFREPGPDDGRVLIDFADARARRLIWTGTCLQ